MDNIEVSGCIVPCDIECKCRYFKQSTVAYKWLVIWVSLTQGSATEQNGVQDLKISLRSQDFCGISRISLRFHKISNFTEIIGKILLGISDLIFQVRFRLGFQHLRPRFHPVADPLALRPRNLCHCIKMNPI